MAKPFKIIQMDAIEYLRTIPDESVNLILTDPPYESLEKWRNVGTTTRLGFEKRLNEDGKKVVDRSKEQNWFVTIANERLEELLTEFERVMKKNSHLYIHCDETTRDILRPLIDKVGLKFWKSLVWDKRAIGMGYHWRAQYEFILFAEKGKRKLNNLGLGDLLPIKRLKGKQYYPTQKPLKLAQMIIENSSAVGDVVLDTFMGAGTTGMAAIRTGRIFWGSDVSEKAVLWTRNRLTKEIERLETKALETAEVQDQQEDQNVSVTEEQQAGTAS